MHLLQCTISTLPHKGSSTMPPKGAFALERLRRFGASAAESARGRLANGGEPPCDQLTCEYCGVAGRGEEYVIDEVPTGRSALAYSWHVCVGGHQEQTVVLVRCDLVPKRGVPFPKNWQTALRCSNLPTIAEDAAKAARDELGNDIDCKLLGVAKGTALPEPGERQPGATVLLAGDGFRMAHILCAQIDGNTWLCHRGSFQDGVLSSWNPLDATDLVTVSSF